MREYRRSSAAVCGLFLAIFAGACASSVYEKEINSFASSAESLDDSFKKLQERERTALEDRELLGAIDRNADIRFFLGNDCNQLDNIAALKNPDDVTAALKAAKTCSLNYVVAERDSKGNLITDENDAVIYSDPTTIGKTKVSAENGIVLSGEIKKYAKALQSIAGSESTSELDKSLTEFSTALGSFGDAIAKAGGASKDTAFSENFSPISAFFNRITLSYVNYRRNMALRRAVKKAHPFIVESAEILKEQMYAAHLVAAQFDYTLARQVVADGLDTNAEDYLADKQKLLSNAKTLRAYAKSNPTAAYNQLTSAHAKLLEKLDDPQTNTKSIFDALQTFAQEVDKLEDIFADE